MPDMTEAEQERAREARLVAANDALGIVASLRPDVEEIIAVEIERLPKADAVRLVVKAAN